MGGISQTGSRIPLAERPGGRIGILRLTLENNPLPIVLIYRESKINGGTHDFSINHYDNHIMPQLTVTALRFYRYRKLLTCFYIIIIQILQIHNQIERYISAPICQLCRFLQPVSVYGQYVRFQFARVYQFLYRVIVDTKTYVQRSSVFYARTINGQRNDEIIRLHVYFKAVGIALHLFRKGSSRYIIN